MFPWNWRVPFGGQQDGKNSGGPFQPEQFQKYVDQMMKQMFPPEYKQMMNNPTSWNPSGATPEPRTSSPFEESVFETHQDVYIRLKISDHSWLKTLKISYTRNQCMITDLPEEGDQWHIQLPAIVKKKGAQAIFKNDILEIKIPKSLEWQETEIELPPF